jgi:hypothetical protein
MRDDAVQAQILTPTGMRFLALSCTFQSSYLTEVFVGAFVMLIMVGEGMLGVGIISAVFLLFLPLSS